MDCGCQTLPQNATKEHAWTAAASLYIRGRANDGALCFTCANKRRETLGLSWEQHIKPPSPAPECHATLKHVCINTREYSWTVSTLECLLTKWHDECLTSHSKNREIKFWIVAVNNEIIPATGFSWMPISDGDSIFIAMGAVAGG
jgi:hypothetical protein